MEVDETGFPAEASYFLDIFPVPLIIDKGAKMDAMVLCQMLQQMIGPDLVSLIRGIRNSMDQIKQFTHESSPDFLRCADR
jgi:hypothetical protein